MKLFTYLSALLITAGAIFGIIDYAKAKNNGTFDKIYSEDPVEDTQPIQQQPSENDIEVKKEFAQTKTVITNESKVSKKVHLITTPKPIKRISKAKPVKVLAKEIKSPKAPIEDVMEEAIIIRPNDEKIVGELKKDATMAPPPAPRKIDYRDFGRGSIRPKKAKAAAVKSVLPKLKEE
jgi:hypothetical protein